MFIHIPPDMFSSWIKYTHTNMRRRTNIHQLLWTMSSWSIAIRPVFPLLRISLIPCSCSSSLLRFAPSPASPPSFSLCRPTVPLAYHYMEQVYHPIYLHRWHLFTAFGKKSTHSSGLPPRQQFHFEDENYIKIISARTARPIWLSISIRLKRHKTRFG